RTASRSTTMLRQRDRSSSSLTSVNQSASSTSTRPDSGYSVFRAGTSVMTFLERNAVWLGLFCVILVASLLRGAGQNWDGSRGWHFGEQWTVQQAVNMDLPDGLANYLDTATSRFNPRNVGPYYSAGTFPLFAGKLVAIAQNQDSYAGLTPTYRSVSAFSDLITVGLMFLIGR